MSGQTQNPTVAVAASANGPRLARCPKCKSFDVTREPGPGRGVGPTDRCTHCGESWPHSPGTVTAGKMAGDEQQPQTAGVMAMAADAGDGHWVTIDGEHVLIREGAGHVPGRLKADGAANRFSKAQIERHLIDHHESVAGKGTYSAEDERWINSHSAGDPFTFHKELPAEIKEHMQGRPELRKLFRVTNDPGKSGGADAFGADGDRYLSIAEAKAGSPLGAAKETARASPDPGVRFLADVHDNLPMDPSAMKAQATKLRARAGNAGAGPEAARMTAKADRLERDAATTPTLENIKSGGLRVGDKFTVGGTEHRVAEDAGGYRVLVRGGDYQTATPVEALPAHVPHDKGSFRAGRAARKETIPFSADAPKVALSADAPAAILIASTDPAEPVLVLGKHPPMVNGKPAHYYRKEIARARDYPYTHRGQKVVNAAGEADFATFALDAARMDKWVDAFHKRLAAGVKPFVPERHVPGIADARENFGYVVDMDRQGDKLYGTFQLIGDEAEAVAARNDVSVYVVADAADANGGRYDECIEHVCLTPNPAIPDLEPFVKIAASAGAAAATVPVFRLDVSGPGGQQQTTQPMNEPPTPAAGRKGPRMNAELRAALALGADVPDDQLDGLALAAVLALKKERDAAKADAAAKGEEVVALSADGPPKGLDPLALSLVSKAFATEEKQLVASGAISQAGVDELRKLYFAGDGRPNREAMALSAGSTEPRYSRLLDVLRRFPGTRAGNETQRPPAGAKPAFEASADPERADAGDGPSVAEFRRASGLPEKAKATA